VKAVAWSPDGQRITSGSDDKTVQVWDAVDGGHIFTYKGHSDWVTAIWGTVVWVRAVAWSPDGKRIASGSAGVYSQYDDYTVQVWEAP
jgi:eukaryotic-like serine/threonine-protein kinase